MKKALLTLIAAFLLAFVLPKSAYAAGEKIIDKAGVLSYEEKEELSQKFEEISDKYDVDVVAAFINNLEGSDASLYADELYDGGGYRPDGILLLYVTEDPEYAFSTKGRGISVFDDDDLRSIIGNCGQLLKQGDYVNALNNYVTDAKRYLDAAGGETKGSNGFLKGIISLIGGFVLGFIPVAGMKSRLKTVSEKHNAADYVKRGSLKISDRRDVFLYKHVDRTPRAESRTGNSTTHTSASGEVHGGISGKL